jgi:hypothetical protein
MFVVGNHFGDRAVSFRLGRVSLPFILFKVEKFYWDLAVSLWIDRLGYMVTTFHLEREDSIGVGL